MAPAHVGFTRGQVSTFVQKVSVKSGITAEKTMIGCVVLYMMVPSDENLIEQFYAGEDEPFAVLETRYTSRLIRFFWKLGIRPPEDCADCAQETWLRVARTRNHSHTQFARNRMPFAVWLFVIAHNVARDCWRRRAVRPQTVPPPQNDKGTDVWDALGSWDARRYEDLYDCIEHLPEPPRTVVRLRMAGFTLQEIAGMLSIGLATSHAHQERAHGLLRACLEDKGHPVLNAAGEETKKSKKTAAGGVNPRGRKD